MTDLILPAAGVAVIVAFLVVRRQAKHTPSEQSNASNRIAKLLAEGRYAQAAEICRRENKLEEALEYYIRAQQLENAAYMAVRLGDVRKGAQLYERAGDLVRAADLYERAGMDDKANQLRGAAAPGTPAPAGVAGVVKAFRDAQSKAGADLASRAEAQRLAVKAAEALLDEGDVREAADIFREAGMNEEAINLYANVLGLPGEAAPLVAALGNHERAAELYELAGKKQRAAAAWVRVADDSERPDTFIDRIERLSPPMAREFLEKRTQGPIDGTTAELHYRLAKLLERLEEIEQAVRVYSSIHAAMGGYKDVAERAKALTQARVVTGTPAPEHPLPSRTRTVEISDGRSPMPTISEDMLAYMAQQVMQKIEQSAMSAPSLLQRLSVTPVAQVKPVAERVIVTGLELQPIILDRLIDSDVHHARTGPTVAELSQYIGSSPCELQNIEVFYRLGLAQLANGQWREAAEAFSQVEGCSPGYRDADERCRAIRQWQAAVPQTLVHGSLDPVPIDEANDHAAPARYELKGELGRGGMAVVYRAVDTVLGREVALKFLSEDLLASEDARRLFEREARSVAALNHPNIVTVFDFGVREERAFICMELVKGHSLETILEAGNQLLILETLGLARQVLTALAYAHGEGIIHRDLKPANIMRTPSGLVKLMDFGLAKSSSDRQSSMIAGTPAYMSPEQLSGIDVDHRTDIFAVGVTLYELITGQLPFEGYKRHVPPPPMSEHNPAIPPLLDQLVARALVERQNDRYQTCGEMLTVVEEILGAVGRFAKEKMPSHAEQLLDRIQPNRGGDTVALRNTL